MPVLPILLTVATVLNRLWPNHLIKKNLAPLSIILDYKQRAMSAIVDMDEYIEPVPQHTNRSQIATLLGEANIFNLNSKPISHTSCQYELRQRRHQWCVSRNRWYSEL